MSPAPHSFRPSGSAEPTPHGANQFAAGGVAAELPEERPAQTVLAGVAHLAADRGRRVVAPPLVAALGVRGARDGPVGRAPALDHLVVLDAGFVGARCR